MADDLLTTLQRLLWAHGSLAMARTEGGGTLIVGPDGEPLARGRSLDEAIARAAAGDEGEHGE